MNPLVSVPAVLQGTCWLLAEDDVTNQELICHLLRRSGIQVVVANNGEEALTKLSTVRVHGILMDCRMPVMDGYEASQRVRSSADYDNIPILAFTGDDSSADRDRMIQLGMDDVIVKPLKPELMFSAMARCLLSRREHRVAPADAKDSREAHHSDSAWNVDGEALYEAGAISELVGDRTTSQVKFLKRFLEHSRNDIQVLISSLDRRNWNELRETAHRMKTSSAAVGAMKLSSCARKLEGKVKLAALAKEEACVVRAQLLAIYEQTEQVIEAELANKLTNDSAN